MWLEQEVTYINHNINLLIASLNKQLGIFGENGGLNVEDKLEWGSEDWGETKKTHLEGEVTLLSFFV